MGFGKGIADAISIYYLKIIDVRERKGGVA